MIRGVPYDHELEYLEFTGTQRIYTDIVPKVYATEVRISIDYQLTATDSRQLSGSNSCYLEFCSSSGLVQSDSRYHADTDRHVLEFFGYSSPRNVTYDGLPMALYGYVAASSTDPERSFIFGALNSSGGYGIKAKVFAMKMTREDGTRLIDLIPVRVGTTALMYDRVTGRFPKHYGTFVAGPVVSTPLMGVHMYPRFMPTPKSYIQRGLIAGWSGIAVGDVPLVWKDFTGHGFDLTINQNTSQFVDNYLNVGSKSTAGAYMNGRLIPDVKHMEICCYVSQNSLNTLLFYNGAVPSNMILTSHSTAGVQTSNTKRHVAYVRTTGYYWLSATHDILYADGKRIVDTTFGTDTWLWGSNSMCLFGRLVDSGYSTAGRIYSARAYTNTLDPDEVAHNYEMDRLMFNLPDPV